MITSAHCPDCGHHLNPSPVDGIAYCPLCDKSIDLSGQKVCQECGGDLDLMAVIGGDQTFSGKTERLYHCRSCLSSWETQADEDGVESGLKRYFFG